MLDAELNVEADPRIRDRAERLKKAVRRAGGVAAISRISEVPVATLNKYIAGRDMKAGALVSLAEACRVSLSWLATGAGPEEAIFGASNSELARFGSALNEPAHYWALLTLVRACREFYEKLQAKPTLAEALSWVAQHYGRASKLPDDAIEFKRPDEVAQ